ncbi:hypothetical protein U1Q18_002336 [Sarracenia purpurea var. burkii]
MLPHRPSPPICTHAGKNSLPRLSGHSHKNGWLFEGSDAAGAKEEIDLRVSRSAQIFSLAKHPRCDHATEAHTELFL